jgi:hypothetical protein
MWMYYLLACIPVAVGAAMWINNKNVVWWEWLASSALGFMTTAIVHVLIVSGMTTDHEIWSGKVEYVVHYPKWIEEYQESHTRIIGSGKNAHTETYYTTEHKTHHPHWSSFESYGGTDEVERDITEDQYNGIAKFLGGVIVPKRGSRHGFDGGDRNDYYCHNTKGEIYPITSVHSFENRVKCSPTVFSFADVPVGTPVFDWVGDDGNMATKRCLGAATASVNGFRWGQMNTRLGASKKVNVFLIGFGEKDSSIAHLQEAKWIGGKKNDLVLCYGGSRSNTTWAYVFGWTESMLVKRNLETILLENKIDDTIIPKVEAEIRANYQIKDWSKFDYIAVEAPWWGVIVVMLVMALSQVAFMYWATQNEFDKGGVENV